MDDGPETWKLSHPEYGLLEVAVARPALLRQLDPGYQRKDAKAAAARRHGVVVLRNGEVIGRAAAVAPHRVDPAAEPVGDGAPVVQLYAFRGPRVVVETDARRRAVRQVRLHRGDDVFAFVAPPGSEAEARLVALEASPWKRVVVPFAGGLGRAGGVVVGMLAAVLLAPVINWLMSLLPSVNLPLPELDVPLPSIDLPSIQLPGWVDPIVETSRVWVPVLVGSVVGVLAVRTARRARRTASHTKPGAALPVSASPKPDPEAEPPEQDEDRPAS